MADFRDNTGQVCESEMQCWQKMIYFSRGRGGAKGKRKKRGIQHDAHEGREHKAGESARNRGRS